MDSPWAQDPLTMPTGIEIRSSNIINSLYKDKNFLHRKVCQASQWVEPHSASESRCEKCDIVVTRWESMSRLKSHDLKRLLHAMHCFLCALPCVPMVVRVCWCRGMMILLWSDFYSAKHEDLLSKQTVFLINPLHTLMRTTSLAKLSDLRKSTLYLLIACALPKCSLFLWRLVVPGYRRYESFCASWDCIIIFAYDYVLYATMKGFCFYVFRGSCLWHLLAVAVIRWPVFSSCHDASSRQTTMTNCVKYKWTNPKKYQEIMLFWRVLTRYVLNDHRYVCRMCVLYAVLGHFRRDKVGCWKRYKTIQNVRLCLFQLAVREREVGG